MKFILKLLTFNVCLFIINVSVAQTYTSLWNDYTANPYNDPNIPNNSYAGYGTGIVPIPNPSYTVYNVTNAPYNAVPGDGADDQPAIQAAIDAAGAAGSGIIYIPSGTYYLNKPLYIKYNNIIVRGAGSTGSGATILDFRYSMYSMFESDIYNSDVGPGGLWWASGLVWIGPANTFKANGAPDMFTDYEHWRSSTTLATITAVSNPGDFSITVNNTSSLSVGMRLLMRYDMPSDRSLIKEIHGHTPTKPGIDNDSYVGNCTNIKAPGEKYYFWPAVIKEINGNTVTFDRPLRIKVDPAAWPAVLTGINGLVTESGIENVQILGHNKASMAHLPTPEVTSTGGGGTSLGGWNGIYINRSWNCWANNIRFVNLECGAIFSAAKNCSVLNTYVTSTASNRWYHHPYAIRVFSSDNLVENFTIDGPGKVYHGINSEWYASGNVYSKGLMKVGTFDSHRGSPFDLIRTEITVANDAGSAPGGATTSGPFAGKRFAHWNIIQQLQTGYPYQSGSSRNGNDVFEPKQFPMGAMVAITGPQDNSNGEYVPPGDLGTVVASGPITDPDLVNLYHAELEYRKLLILPVQLLSFSVQKSPEEKVKIEWKLADREDNDQLILQWSTDGTHFSNISHQVSTKNISNYQYTHTAPVNGVNYYRLKIVSPNGATQFSTIKTIKIEGQEKISFSIYPNPVTDKVAVKFATTHQVEAESIRILDASGRIMKVIKGNGINTNQLTIDVTSIPSGYYYIEIATGSGNFKSSFVKK